MEEKRAFPRTACEELIKFTNGKKAQAQDISLSGMRFRTLERIPAGTVLNMNFSLQSKGSLKTTGIVVWSKVINRNAFECGLKFNYISQDGKLILSDYINQKLHHGAERRNMQRFLIDVCVNHSMNAKARTRNITESGMSIFTNNPLVEKQMLLLSIPLPAGDSISMHGKTVWNRRVKDDLYENGIEFWNIQTNEKEKLSLLAEEA